MLSQARRRSLVLCRRPRRRLWRPARRSLPRARACREVCKQAAPRGARSTWIVSLRAPLHTGGHDACRVTMPVPARAVGSARSDGCLRRGSRQAAVSPSRCWICWSALEAAACADDWAEQAGGTMHAVWRACHRALLSMRAADRAFGGRRSDGAPATESGVLPIVRGRHDS